MSFMHFYVQEIKRKVHKEWPLKLPRNLQKDLPFALKPKLPPKSKDLVQTGRVAVVLDSKERKVRKNGCTHSVYYIVHAWLYYNKVE